MNGFKTRCEICERVFSVSNSGLSQEKINLASEHHIEKMLEQNPLSGINQFVPRKMKYRIEMDKAYRRE